MGDMNIETNDAPKRLPSEADIEANRGAVVVRIVPRQEGWGCYGSFLPTYRVRVD